MRHNSYKKHLSEQLTKLKEEEEMCSFPTTDPENDNAENSEKEATVRRRESLLPKEEGETEEKGEKNCKVQVVEPEIHLKPVCLISPYYTTHLNT